VIHEQDIHRLKLAVDNRTPSMPARERTIEGLVFGISLILTMVGVYLFAFFMFSLS
jgi:hypothetical protein